jgi:preprotein translocase subunit SecD
MLQTTRPCVPLFALALLAACSSEPAAPEAPQRTKAAEAARPAAAQPPAQGPTRTLRLGAEEGSGEELKRTVAVLNERLRLAEIRGEARLEGERTIAVALPDDEETLARAAGLLLSGGELMFYPLVTEEQIPSDEILKKVEEIQIAKQSGTYDRAKAPYDVVRWKGSEELALVESPGVPGYLLSKVEATKDSEGKPAVDFVMTRAGSEQFHQFTAKNVLRRMASVFDGELIVAPTIREAIQGSGILTGDFTEEEVKDLVTILKSGKLPVALSLEAN